MTEIVDLIARFVAACLIGGGGLFLAAYATAKVIQHGLRALAPPKDNRE